MSTLIRDRNGFHTAHSRSYLSWGAAMLFIMGAFFLVPGDIEEKAHLALHGVCAQRSSHSLHLGEGTLPLDARMTGIYLGAVTMIIWLAATRRLRARARPSVAVLASLATFVLIMAVDGGNALLADLGLPGFYQPSNAMRVATGSLAGVALGAAVGHLFAITIWRIASSRTAVIARPAELVMPVVLAGALGSLALSGLPVLFAPFALGLVIAVIAVFAALLLIVIILASGRAWSIDDCHQLSGLAAAAFIMAALMLSVLAGMRLIAEQAFGLPQLT